METPKNTKRVYLKTKCGTLGHFVPPIKKVSHYKFIKLFMDCVVHYSSLDYSNLSSIFLSSAPLSLPQPVHPSQSHLLTINHSLNSRFTQFVALPLNVVPKLRRKNLCNNAQRGKNKTHHIIVFWHLKLDGTSDGQS